MNQAQKKQQSMDMTSGSITKLLIMFAVPLTAIQHCGQSRCWKLCRLPCSRRRWFHHQHHQHDRHILYRYLLLVPASSSAGTMGPTTTKKLHIAVETTMAVTFICGIIFSGLGIFVAPYMLKFMSTPDDVLPSASVYLKIYFSGVFGLLVYNMGSAILRAVGDTKRPLYFLCLSSVMNIGLDLLFCSGLRHGHRGSCLRDDHHLPVWFRNSRAHRSHQKHGELLPDLEGPADQQKIFRQILMVGLLTGFQQSLTSFSNVYVQSYINTFGSSCMAGWSSYSKIDQFVFLPMQSIGQASTTFMSQNLGAGNLPPREKKEPVWRSGWHSSLHSPALGSFSSLRLGSSQSSTRSLTFVRYGTMFLRMNVFMLAFCCPNQVVAGAMRGAGDSRTPMLIMLFSFVLFRQIYLYIATSICNTAAVVGFGYPVGWIVASVLVELYYMSGKWEKKINM